MRLVWIIFHLGSATRISAAQTGSSDFSITLERAPCFGTCSSYKVTIYGDGSVLYEGRDYVAVKGVKRAVISRSTVQSLEKELRTNDFLHWQEEKKTCVDFPEVHIVANLHGEHKRVVEGCNKPGKVLKLAEEIDRISGDERWVRRHH